MINRVTSKSTYDRLLKYMLENANRLQDVQEKLASGKRINKPSDDPLGTIKTLDYRGIVSNIDRFLGNIDFGSTWVNQIDSVMSNMSNLVSRAKSLAISQGSDTADATSRKGTAREIEGIYEQMINFANTQVGDDYVFGGSITDQPPFDETGEYHGNDERIQVEISKGVKANINAVGSQFLSTDLNPAISLNPPTAGYTFSSQEITSQFLIDSGNQGLRVRLAGDTGGTRTIQMDTGTYTGEDLASAVQAKIRLLGQVGGVDYSKVTVTYDASTNHFVFNSGDPAVNFDTLENAPGSTARQTLGFSADITGNGDTDVESDTAVSFNVLAGVNDSFTISVDGGPPHAITLAAGTYTAASLATEMQNALNAALGNGVVTVDYNASHPNRFTLTSSTTGTTSSVSLTPGTNDFLRMVKLEPDLSVNGTEGTRISDLNQGKGVTLGTLRITDRAGNTADVDLSAAVTVKDILDAINGASGIQVTASLNATKNGIILTDTNAPPAQRRNLSVEDLTGTTARDLGIRQDVPGNIHGKDLDPIVSADTRVSALYGGHGMTLGKIEVENNGVKKTIDLTESRSVADILQRINADSNSALHISASIMRSGKALDVRSTHGGTVALVYDADPTKSSSKLGIQGENDILKTLRLLREALDDNDGNAIRGLLKHFDEGLNKLLEEHAHVGASSSKLERAGTIQKELKINTTKALSNTEDADLMKTMTDFTMQQYALQVTLESAARIVHPTLLDFLK